MYTDPNFEDTPVYDHSSVLEKCYQLKHDNESLKEENVKLQYQLESAEETIKKSSTQLIILGQKLSSLSDAAEERDKLLEFLEKEKASRSVLQTLLEEQKCRNVQLEAQSVVAEEKEIMLNDKIFKLEKQLKEKEQQFKELIQIVYDYEYLLEEKQNQVAQKSQELVLIKDELCQLRTKIKDADENITSVQMSNSNVDQTEENVLPHFIDERSSSPQTGLTIEYSGLKSPAIQSHYEPPFIRIQSPAVSVHQKSLADELYEADVDSRGVQTTSFKCGVDLFGKCVQCRSCLSFRKDNEIELQNNLLIQLRAFKNKMKCKRDWSDQFSSYLLHYGKTGMSCLHWSTEDINDVTSGSKKHFGLIIQQCWEILLLARIYFEKPPMPLNKVLMNIWKQFPKTVISGQALPNRSWSSPTIYASVNNSCRRRNTSDKTIQTGNGDDAIQRIDPRVTAKDHISCPNEKLYNEKPTNEKFQNGFTISFEELMNSLKADQENSVFDINIRTLANIRSEISLAHEVLTLKKEPLQKVNVRNIQCMLPKEENPEHRGNTYYQKGSFISDHALKEDLSQNVLTLNKIIFFVNLLLSSQYKSDSATERHAYLIKLLKYLETQIYWSSERLTHISYLKTKKELINNSIRNINERTFTDTVSSIACFVNTSNSENGITSVSSHSNVNKDALKLNSQIYFKRYLITLRNSAKKLEVVWSSHCSFFLKNLVDNTKSVFSYPRIFYADDITWKMFMVLCLLGIFCCAMLYVMKYGFTLSSEVAENHTLVSKFYSCLKHVLVVARKTRTNLYSKLFDVTLNLEYSSGSPPI